MGQLQTRNCTIFFVDVEDGQFRAGALAQTCESDIRSLASLFRISFDVDGLNGGGVRVYVISPPGGGASNVGWGGLLGGTSDMDLNGDFAPAKPDSQTPIVRAELVRFLFAAELAEIMMGITSSGWNPGSSEGEALSIVLGTELRPMGYYGPASGAPRVNSWLQSGREDWISTTELTDKNELSYGCGVLFINYLRHQLRFDLASIIATRPPFDLTLGGCTLASRYAELTGKPAAAAFPEFMNFLEQHLPSSLAAQEWVGRDDIFPLQTPQNRSVFVSTATTQISYDRKEPPSHVTLKPGLLCGEGEYQYWRVEEISQMTASASASGFASAAYQWSINGQTLVPTSDSLRTVQLQADVAIPQPDRTVSDQPAATVQVQYLINPTWNRSTLLIRNDSHDGLEHFHVHVSATETFVNDATVSAEATADLSTLHYEYATNFAEDQRRCNGDLEQVSADLAKLSHEMELFRVAPDPQPDARIAAVLDAAQTVNARLAAAVDNMGAAGQIFRQELGRGSRIADEVAAARSRALQAQPPAAQNQRQT